MISIPTRNMARLVTGAGAVYWEAIKAKMNCRPAVEQCNDLLPPEIISQPHTEMDLYFSYWGVVCVLQCLQLKDPIFFSFLGDTGNKIAVNDKIIGPTNYP